MDRAELIIALSGDKQALSSLENLRRAMTTLNASKVQLKVDKSLADREIASLQQRLRDLRNDKAINIMLGMDTSEVQAEIIATKQRLDELTGEKRQIQLDISDINLAREGLDEVEQDFQEASQAAADFLNTVGSVFSTLSDLSGATAAFASGIGEAFSAMGSIFDTNLFDYAQRKLTYMATEGVVGDFGRIISRYDILSTFTQYMDAAGVSADRSAVALQRVNDAILGLPIGLDEAAYRLRRYQMFLDNIDDATNLTIGLQNVLLAGGANEQMRTTSYYQIDRLLAAGRLNTSRQWVALLQGMGVSVRYVAQEMGVAGMSARELAAGLSSGQIPAQDLLRAIMRLGEGTSEAAQDLSGLLDIYRNTLESWISNIQFAAVRGGETVLKALNQSLLEVSDQGVVGYMRNLRDAMNDMYKGIGGFITGNPDIMRNSLDAISGLMDALSRFSASNIATMVFDNLARGVDGLARVLRQLPVSETEEFLAFATTLASPLGTLFRTVASGAPRVLAVFERFKNFNFERLLDRIVEEVGNLADVFARLLGVLPDEALIELLTFGLVYGTPVAAAFDAISKAFVGLAAAVLTISTITGSAGFASFTAFLASLPAMVPAIVALVAAFGALAIADNVRVNNMADALGLNDFDHVVRTAEGNVRQVSSLIDAQTEQYDRLDAKLEHGKQLARDILALNETATTPGDIALLSRQVSELESAFPGLSIEIDKTTGKLTSAGKAAVSSAEDFIQLATDAAKAEAALKKISEYTSVSVELEIDERMIQNRIDEINAALEELSGNALEPIFVGEDKARDNNDARRAYKRELKELERQLAETQSAQEKNNAALSESQNYYDEMSASADAYAEATGGVTTANEEAAASADALASKLAKLGTDYSVARDEAEKSITKQIDLFTKMDEQAAVSLADLSTALQSNMDAITSYRENMEKAAEIITSHPELGTQASSLFGDVASMGISGAGQMAALVEAYETDYDSFLEYVKNYTATKNAEEELIDWNALLTSGMDPDSMALFISESFGEALEKTVAAMPNTLPNLLGAESFSEELLAFGKADAIPQFTGLKSLGVSMGQSLAEGTAEGVAQADTSKAGQKLTENIVESASDAAKNADVAPVVGAFADSIDDAMGRAGFDVDALIENIVDQISQADWSPVSAAISNGISSGGINLSAALTTLNSDDLSLSTGGTGSAGELLTGFEGLSVAMSAFTDIGAPAAILALTELDAAFSLLTGENGGLTALVDGFEWIWETSIPGIQEAFDDFLESLTTIEERLLLFTEGAVVPAEVLSMSFYELHIPELIMAIFELISAINELTDELYRLVRAMEDARTRAEAMRAAINALGREASRQAPVLDAFRGSVYGISAAATEAARAVAELASAMSKLESKNVSLGFSNLRMNRFATGGPVYLASGGSFFKPHGTDTVPAMLTPGEFVMKRAAVKAFGMEFMAKINSLDLGAAVQALYRHVPKQASQFMPVFNNVNNNDNRNVNVNQNIYTNNPDYSFRMTSRWAHAL